MHWVLTESWLTPDQLSENHPGLWNKSEEREDWFISQDWSQTTTGSGGWIKKRVDRKLHKNSDLTSAGPQFWKLFELSDPVFIAQDANELTMWTNIKGKQKSEQNFFVIIWNKQTLRISKNIRKPSEKEKKRKIEWTTIILLINAGFSAEMFSRQFPGRKTSLGVGVCVLGRQYLAACYSTDGWWVQELLW